MSEPRRCGYVAIVGRPNVGKSTLLNRLLGQKISITSPKPQTTRHRILGIKTEGATQFLYVDTPGLHRGARRALNRYMNRAAADALIGVDVVIFVVEALQWTAEDALVLERLGQLQAPVIVAVNKVDRLPDKGPLLPYLQVLASKGEFAEVVPLSARKGKNLEALEACVAGRLPEGEFAFPEDQITDRSERFMVAELVREQLVRSLADELPYALTVEIEQFEDAGELSRVSALIWVERPGQKLIVIGKDGTRLREVGRRARLAMERLLQRRVFLQLWVKVREGWADDERALRTLGYSD